MAEKIIYRYLDEARQRWDINALRVIHRVGCLKAGDQIVFVGAASPHRKDAFSATEFVMDKLKTEAPFWKKENQQWLEAKASDSKASQRWD